MKKILCEGKFGHGGKRSLLHTLQRKINRLSRPKFGKASIPFNWNTPVDNLSLVTTVKNQFQADSCGGEAASYGIAISNALKTGTYTELSAKSIYSKIFYPGGGTTVPALENQVRYSGVNLEADVPSYINGTTTESFMEDRSWSTPLLAQKALIYAGYIPVTVSIDMDSIAWAIQKYGWVLVELSGQNNGTWLSSNPKPPTSNQNLWNHFMCFAMAGAQNVPTLGAMQSWGADTGNNGRQYFTSDYVTSGYILDVVAFIPPTTAPSVVYGQSSPDVKTMQEKLGMPVNLCTGYFGFLTLCALVGFEIKNRLSITSTITPTTWTLLNQ